jgi:hypothetical protein
MRERWSERGSGAELVGERARVSPWNPPLFQIRTCQQLEAWWKKTNGVYTWAAVPPGHRAASFISDRIPRESQL